VSVRATDAGVASHARLVYENVIPGIRAAFDNDYDREPQLRDLRVSADYPLRKIDYPAVVVEYSPQRVVSAGVGHEEWFTDPAGHFRRWKHSRFEGTLTLRALALSTLDRDILADALAELVRFGDLEPQLNRFYEVIYPTEQALFDDVADGERYSWRLFGQLMLDSDQLMAVGNSATVAPWQPEDVLVYSGGWSMNLHGGYYNSYPRVDWRRVTRIVIDAYAQDRLGHDLPFPGHAEVAWSPPLVFADAAVVSGSGSPSAQEDYFQGELLQEETVDAGTAHGRSSPSGAEA